MNNLRKSYIWNTLGSGLNSFNSFFFLVIVTRINGISMAGIFTLAFASASMFYAIAIYSGRTYQVTENDKSIGDKDYVGCRFLCCFIMLLASIIFVLINKYTSLKLIIFILLCFFKLIEAICDVFHGILQKNDCLDKAGKSLFIRSLLNIVLFLLIDIITKNLILACISLIVSNILILFLIDIRISYKYFNIKDKTSKESILKILRYGFYIFGVSFIANYLVNAPRYAMDNLLGDDMQTIFGVIVMPASIIMLLSQFIFQPIVISLKKSYQDKNKKEFLKYVYIVICLTILVGLVAIIFAYLLGIPFLNFIYKIDISKYLSCLIIILIGATLYTLSSVLSNSLIVFRKNRMQLYIYIITSIFAYFISNKLIKIYGFYGTSYAYLLVMILLLLMYIIYFIVEVNKKELWRK